MVNIKFDVKRLQSKLTRGLLDIIVLRLITANPMHGYQIILKIRKLFGVYFGPSTIYPLLYSMEKKGYLNSVWNLNSGRPKKIYDITTEGQKLLTLSENILNLILSKSLPRETAVLLPIPILNVNI